MSDAIFDLCVKLLIVTAHLFGTTYKAINVWIFVVIWPVALVVLGAVVLYQRGRIGELERRVRQGS